MLASRDRLQAGMLVVPKQQVSVVTHLSVSAPTVSMEALK